VQGAMEGAADGAQLLFICSFVHILFGQPISTSAFVVII
jgi:hypothetical protein